VNPLLKHGSAITSSWKASQLQEWKNWDFTQGFYYGFSQEAKEHIDNHAGGTFFLLQTQEARALFEKITASERESEEYNAKENSCATMIDPLTQMFQGLALK
jgi:hypothetical protein